MKKRTKRLLRRRLGVGGIGLPLWTGALAILVLAVAGQALGPVLSGMVTGSTGVVVEQSLRLTDDSVVYSNFGFDDAILTINDEGTAFTAAMELHAGALDNIVTLVIENTSGATANAMTRLVLPPGLRAEMESEIGTDVTEAQLDGNTWILTLTEDSKDEDLDITLLAEDNIMPGFYSITGQLLQTSG